MAHQIAREGDSVISMFSAQAERNADRVALQLDELRLSYRQLDQRANAIAHRLLALGVKPGDNVGLYMDRSVEIIVAKIAILKCGAAYLPLDKNNPPSRNQRCIEEAQPTVLIADSTGEAFTASDGLAILDCRTTPFDDENAMSPDIAVGSEETAYLMFTSGSTGAPKGVVVPHRAILRLVCNPDYISITPDDRILQFSSLSFDASTFEIWGALLNGATLVLYPQAGIDPQLLARQLRDHSVSILFLTTALFHIVASRFISMLSPLRVLLTGGDVLYPALVNQVADHHPQLHLVICYGPTENTTFTTTHRITDASRPQGNVPIGLPIRGTEVHVLDEGLAEVADNTTGELFVSGTGTALGYLNRENSSSDFFRDSRIAPGLIYRTGDLVRRNSRGDLEFVGRRDNQVKIRGYRVSLEEVQSAVLGVPDVQDAVAVVHRYDNGDQLLIAYVRLADGLQTTPAEIKRRLADRLPRYLIPDRVNVNSDFPLNKNGKICRESLRQMHS